MACFNLIDKLTKVGANLEQLESDLKGKISSTALAKRNIIIIIIQHLIHNKAPINKEMYH